MSFVVSALGQSNKLADDHTTDATHRKDAKLATNIICILAPTSTTPVTLECTRSLLSSPLHLQRPTEN